MCVINWAWKCPLQMLGKNTTHQWLELKPSLPSTGQKFTSLKASMIHCYLQLWNTSEITEYETLISFAISNQHLNPKRRHKMEGGTETAPLTILSSCAVFTVKDLSLFPLQVNLTLLKSGAFTCLFNYFLRNQTQR